MCPYLGAKTGIDDDATGQAYSSLLVAGVGVTWRGKTAFPGAGTECTMIPTLFVRRIVKSATSATWQVVSTA